jgi:hypothetical protein
MDPALTASLNTRMDSLRVACLGGNVAELRESLERFALTLTQEYGDLEIGKAFHTASQKVMVGMPANIREGVTRATLVPTRRG